MIQPEEALRRVLEAVSPLGFEDVPLTAAAGRVLTRDLSARAENPPFDNSAMDGYALLSRDTASASKARPVSLRLAGAIPAGTSPGAELRPGQAARILTGAPVPRGADAVIMQEETEASGGRIKVFAKVRPGEHVRGAGEDIRRGEVLVEAGRRIGSLETALLASQGILRVPAAVRPRVSILSTGDELVDPEEEAEEGRIRNCNGLGLSAAVRASGGAPADKGIVRDDPEAAREAFAEALEDADMLLVSGGVSVGDHDYTRAALEELGMKTLFWRVAVKPGKPLLFGMRGRTAVFGLPGNPVSVWASFEEFVRPALERMLGLRGRERWPLRGTADNDYPPAGPRHQQLFCRAHRKGAGYALEIIRPQNSGMLGTAARADALAWAPAGRVRKGDRLRFRLLR